MIIRCPNCNTKFSIRDEQVEAVSNPRFHCSLCDCMFPLASEVLVAKKQPDKPVAPEKVRESSRPNEVAIPSIASAVTKVTKHPSPETVVEETKKEPSLAKVEAKESVLKKVAQDIQEELPLPTPRPTATPGPASNLLDEEPKPLVTVDWPTDTSQSQYEVDMREALQERLKKSPTTPVVTAQESSSPFRKPKRTTRAPSPMWNTTGMLYDEEDELDFEKNSSELKSDETPRHLIYRKAPRTGSQQTAFGPVLSISLVPILLCVGFWQLGLYLSSEPNITRQVLASLGAAPAIVAPAEVELSDLTPALVTLDDGTRVLEITGGIQNGTPFSFGDIQIEAKLYNSENQTIEETIFNVNNGLLHADRIISLKADAIDDLQKTSSLSPKPLAPGEQTPLRVVFTDSWEKALWLSARVYSVRPVEVSSG